jgi:hypothetical protein
MSKPRSRRRPNPAWFPKGRSGNLEGRPKGSRVSKSSVFEEFVDKTFTVTQHGVAREMTMKEALQQRIYQDALAGNRMAQREVLKWINKRQAWRAKHRPKSSYPLVEILISPDPDNADAALLLLGIAEVNPERAEFGKDRAQLLLKSWAVQAALRRRRGGQRLTDDERAEIRRRTRDPGCLRWPRGTDE